MRFFSIPRDPVRQVWRFTLMLCKECNFLFLEQCYIVGLMHQNAHIVYSELNESVLSLDIVFLIPSGFMIKKLQQNLILIISLNSCVTCSLNMM
jgi:hypothetical protein